MEWSACGRMGAWTARKPLGICIEWQAREKKNRGGKGSPIYTFLEGLIRCIRQVRQAWSKHMVSVNNRENNTLEPEQTLMRPPAPENNANVRSGLQFLARHTSTA